MSEAMNKIKKIKNRILAIPAAATAIPPKPNTAATIAMRRKVSVHCNIFVLHVPKFPFHSDPNLGHSRDAAPARCF